MSVMERLLNLESGIAAITSSISAARGAVAACWRMAAQEFSHGQRIAEFEIARGADHEYALVAQGLALAVLVPEEEATFVVKPQKEIRFGGHLGFHDQRWLVVKLLGRGE